MKWQPCGYGCGRPWRPFAGTKLIGHALCAVPPQRQDAILEETEVLGARITINGHDGSCTE